MADWCEDASDGGAGLAWEDWVAGWEALEPEAILEEREACASDPAYFIEHFCWLKDDQRWIRFALWGFQVDLVDFALSVKLLTLLKARQLGATWVFLGIILWGALFEPGSLALVFSLKASEAKKLLWKIKEMYRRLPRWLQAEAVEINNEAYWRLTNGSIIEAYPASGGDSNNARRVLVDEADLIRTLSDLLDSLEPTINDGSSQLWMISRSLKRLPNSTFKRIYREAKGDPQSPWDCIFFPWSVRPDRDAAWYEARCKSALAKDGSLDSVHGNYPASDAEALAPPTLGKRLPSTHLVPVYTESRPLADHELPRNAPSIPGVRFYKPPEPGREYRLGADPAEGLAGASNDDSALSVVDLATGEEVATGAGRWEPTADFPAVIAQVVAFYNDCPVLYERNNHGHALRRPLEAAGVTILDGPDGKPGYAKNAATKAILWAVVWGIIVERAREIGEALKAGESPPAPLLRDWQTYTQASSLESDTCKAPPGEHDDVADAWGHAQFARTLTGPQWVDW